MIFEKPLWWQLLVDIGDMLAPWLYLSFFLILHFRVKKLESSQIEVVDKEWVRCGFILRQPGRGY